MFISFYLFHFIHFILFISNIIKTYHIIILQLERMRKHIAGYKRKVVKLHFQSDNLTILKFVLDFIYLYTNFILLSEITEGC